MTDAKVVWVAFLARDHSGWVLGPLGPGISEYKDDPAQGKFKSYDEAHDKAVGMNRAAGFTDPEAFEFSLRYSPRQPKEPK